MKRYRISRRARRASTVALASAVLVPVAAAAGPAAAATPRVSCVSARPGLAAKLTADITAALKEANATMSVGLHDRTTRTTCALGADTPYDSASVVKITVLGTLLWDARQTHRQLGQDERDLATAMITKSDNDATTALWKQLGVPRVQGFLNAAGMTETVPDTEGSWGLTQITARDEQKQIDLITGTDSTVLDQASRAYILDLMSKVVDSQRWGTPAGAPATATAHLKNGWLQRSTGPWRVHSVGAFTGGGHDYTMTVLTRDSPSMDDGIRYIEDVARAVHTDLNAGS